MKSFSWWRWWLRCSCRWWIIDRLVQPCEEQTGWEPPHLHTRLQVQWGLLSHISQHPFFFLRSVPGIARIVKCIYPDTFSVLNRLTAWNKSAAWWIKRIRSCYGTLSTCCCNLGYFVLLKVRSLHEEAILRMEAETRQKHQFLIERQNFQGSQAKSHNPRETLEPPRSSADIQIFMGHVRRIRPPSPFPYSSPFYFWWLLIFDDNLL